MGTPGAVGNTKRRRRSAPPTFLSIPVLDLSQQQEGQMLSLHCLTRSSKPTMSSITMSPTKPKGRNVKLIMGTTGTTETMEITEITGTTTKAGLSQTWGLASLVPRKNLVSG